MQIKEIWKPVKGFEGIYEISNLGRAKSIARKRNAGKGSYIQKEKMLIPQKTVKGYCFIHLRKNLKSKCVSLHRAVAFQFVDGYKEGLEVNHIDECKSNNKASNLEWMTHKGNCNYGTRSDKFRASFNGKGSNNSMYGRLGKKNPKSKIVIQLDMNGNFIKEWENANQAKREKGFNSSAIHRTSKGFNSHHKGYKWEYKTLTIK